MKKTKAADAIQGKIGQAVEAPVHPDQRAVEAVLLATLATVIHGDQADLKYEVLARNATGYPSGTIGPPSPPHGPARSGWWESQRL